MKLEEQVCSLELAKKLKDLGVNQESWFYWNPPVVSEFDGSHEQLIEGQPYTLSTTRDCREIAESFSAFTVAELGEMLPAGNFSGSKRFYTNTPGRIEGEVVWLAKWVTDGDFYNEFAKTEANARAKVLIYLLKNKLMGAA